MTWPLETSCVSRPWEADCSDRPREANCGCLSRNWIRAIG